MPMCSGCALSVRERLFTGFWSSVSSSAHLSVWGDFENLHNFAGEPTDGLRTSIVGIWETLMKIVSAADDGRVRETCSGTAHEMAGFKSESPPAAQDRPAAFAKPASPFFQSTQAPAVCLYSRTRTATFIS